MVYQVLIVDDEEIACRGLAQFIKWEEHGFEVAGMAYSADEALLLMDKMNIDVVFMDIRMPGKSGLELLKILQKEYPDVKSVILSGFSDFSYAQDAIRHGASDYLTKPVNFREVENLLERLKAEFIRQQKDARIHVNYMEGLLLSIAKGYTLPQTEKYDFPKLDRWYGVAMALSGKELDEAGINEKKERLKGQIAAIVPETVLLNSEAYTLFGLIPYREEQEFDSFLAVLEQLCCGQEEWSCGVSKFKRGLEELPGAWQEVNEALRYRRASARGGIILYQNIEQLFCHNIPEVKDIIAELLRHLTNPDTRLLTVPWLMETLEGLQPRVSTTEFQTVCIRCLIELNGYLRGLNLDNPKLHTQLNAALGQILSGNDSRDITACMIDYFRWLTDILEQSEGQQMGSGVVREIQLFIRRHYSEGISLNMLAEQFYLHPNYLSRLIKEKTGRNFVEYLTEVRMNKAEELLRESDYKIIEICAMVGYDNPRYFSKVFKQYTGMTPRDYREEAGSEAAPAVP